MLARFLEAMTIVRKKGRPTLFITFTCNPKWPEIEAELLHMRTESGDLGPKQDPALRPDITARVFKMKLRELLDDLTKRNVFGPVVADVHVVEFQKRGLPHAHILLILDPKHVPTTTAELDATVCAEIPDPARDPILHDLVRLHMIHGPHCHSKSPCWKNGKCSKFFPKAPIMDTYLRKGKYPEYRRRTPALGGGFAAKTRSGEDQ